MSNSFKNKNKITTQYIRFFRGRNKNLRLFCLVGMAAQTKFPLLHLKSFVHRLGDCHLARREIQKTGQRLSMKYLVVTFHYLDPLFDGSEILQQLRYIVLTPCKSVSNEIFNNPRHPVVPPEVNGVLGWDLSTAGPTVLFPTRPLALNLKSHKFAQRLYRNVPGRQ